MVRRTLVIGVVAALASGLVPALPVGTAAVPEAQASTCWPAGGQDQPFDIAQGFDSSSYDVVVTGGGWGHGVGMSQYGAKGAADLGCTYTNILGTYYPGTRATTASQYQVATVRVGMTDRAAQTNAGAVATYRADSAPVTWEFDGSCEAGREAACRIPPPTQPQGTTWRVRAIRHGSYDDQVPDTENAKADGAYRIEQLRSDGTWKEIWRGGDRHVLLRAMHSGEIVTVTVGSLTREFRWGYTLFDSWAEGDGKMFVVQHVTSGGGVSGMDRYLWGLAEVPSSWPVESLKAQVLAARSYAYKRIGLTSRVNPDTGACRCDLYATVRDQHYTGWAHERADRNSGARWKAAVDATIGQVVTYNGGVIDAFYSSSHGGWSDASKDVWGGDIAYLQAVDTSRWEARSGNTRQRWTVGFTNEELAQKFGLASFGSLEITERGAGGRPVTPDGARVTGRDSAGEVVTRTYSGEQLRSRLGTYSALVHVRKAPPPPDEPEPEPDAQPTIEHACPPDDVPEAGFEDVPVSDGHRPAIDCVVWWDVAQGKDDRTYEPRTSVTREQMATFVANALRESGYELPDGSGEDEFADIARSHHRESINAIAKAGLVQGRTAPDGRQLYAPAEAVSRAQMATYVVATFELAAQRELTASRDYFNDVPEDSPHREAINRAREALIATGVGGGRYEPGGEVTRAQMASFIARTLDALVQDGVTMPPSDRAS